MKKLCECILIFAVMVVLAGCATQSPLHKAAEQGDINEVRKLIEQGADINANAPSLAIAAAKGHIDIVRLFIEKGADVKSKSRALISAAYYGKFEIVKLLIEKGADVNAKPSGWTALTEAAIEGHTEIVKLLIEKGADVNVASDYLGYTPLGLAAYSNHSDIMKILIDSGADIDMALASLEKDAIKHRKDDKPQIGSKLLENFAKRQKIAVKSESAVTSSSHTAIKSDVDIIPNFKSLPLLNDLAIVIGIENYQGLPKSDFSKTDAGIVKDYLKALGFAERNIELITDERATKSSIEKSIEAWLPNRVKKDSRVIVYYSGHGAPEPKTGDAYMVPFDGDPNYLEVTGYPLKRLYEKLGKLQAAEVVVLLDSCFSGAGGRSVLAKGARPLVMMTEGITVPQNMAVLTATQGTQISTSSPEKGHGIFTYYFLKALKDGKKNIAEIYEYIKPLVEDEAKQLNVQQSPSINPDIEKLKGRFGLRK